MSAPAAAPDALDVLEDPFALRDPFADPPLGSPGPTTTSDAAATLVRPAPVPAPEPAPAPPTVYPEVPDIDEDALLGRRKKGSLHPAALALIAAGAVFGGVAAFLLLRPAPQPPQIVYVTASASTTPAASPPPGGPTTEASAAAADPTEAPKPGTTGRPLGGPWPANSKAGTPAAPLDMSGLSGPSVAGPSNDPTGGPQTAGGGQLSTGEISGVVEANRPMVKRRCWQPALDATKGLGGSSARVSATIVIAPSGAVQVASASGAEKDYPGLSSCIAARIKAWKFPASGGTTPVNIPFVFAAQ